MSSACDRRKRDSGFHPVIQAFGHTAHGSHPKAVGTEAKFQLGRPGHDDDKNTMILFRVCFSSVAELSAPFGLSAAEMSCDEEAEKKKPH